MQQSIGITSLALSLLLGIAMLGYAQQQTIRIATYDVSDFDSTNLQQRTALRTVIDSIGPDILIVDGLSSGSLYIRFSEDVLDMATPPYKFISGEYNGPDIGTGIFWRSTVDRPHFGSELLATRTGRGIERVSVTVISSPDTLHAFVCDLTEGPDSAARAKRTIEAEDIAGFIRTQVPVEHNYPIVVGGMNTYDSSEIASLLVPGQRSTMIDPANSRGAWHGNEAFSGVLTYPTRATGADSGLNDRFDYILVPAVGSLYKPGSYTVFGNDGMHFHDSIGHQPNTAVTPELATALQRASAHLPVYADFVFTVTSGVEPNQALPAKMWLSEMRNDER